MRTARSHTRALKILVQIYRKVTSNNTLAYRDILGIGFKLTWIHSIKKMDSWRVLVNAVLNFRLL